MHLSSVSSPHEGHDHPHLGLGQSKEFCQLYPDYRGILGSSVDNKLAGRLPKRYRRVWFDMPMLDLRGGVNILKNFVGVFETRLHVTVFYMVYTEHVAVGLKMESGHIQTRL